MSGEKTNVWIPSVSFTYISRWQCSCRLSKDWMILPAILIHSAHGHSHLEYRFQWIWARINSLVVYKNPLRRYEERKKREIRFLPRHHLILQPDILSKINTMWWCRHECIIHMWRNSDILIDAPTMEFDLEKLFLGIISDGYDIWRIDRFTAHILQDYEINEQNILRYNYIPLKFWGENYFF